MNQPRPEQAANAAWQIQTLADSAKQLAERGQMRDAEDIYRRILDVAPYHVRALNFLAVQALLRGELNQSQAYLEQALRAAPDRAILHQNMALVQKEQGDLDGALIRLDQAIALQPSHRIAFLHKGTVLEALGRKDEAVAAYWQAWMRTPNPDGDISNPNASPRLRDLMLQAVSGIRMKQIEMIAEALVPVHERHGAEALTRVDEAAAIFVGRQSPNYAHGLQRPSFIYLPGVTPRAFMEREAFSWVKQLEAATDDICAELEPTLTTDEGLTPYVHLPAGTDLQQWAALNDSLQWSALHLHQASVPNAANLGRFPATAKALAAMPVPQIPGQSPESFFSILRSGAHIPSHFGLANYKLTVHLPLIVPQDCAIRVGNETRSWKKGECLILDDSFQHEAWNRSSSPRAVLITEIWNPEVSDAEREGITALVGAIGDFNRKFGSAA